MVSSYIREELDDMKRRGVYRTLPVLEGANDPVVSVGGRRMINMSSNNYLGFANHPRTRKAAMEAIEMYGAGAGAVRTIVGNMAIHEELDRTIAIFKEAESATSFQSGFVCNLGIIQAVTNEDDLIISDELNHASIIDGVRLSKAARAVFAHSDMDSLEGVLSRERGKHRNVLIITDGVFSMDGDIANLPDIVSLAERYGSMTYVDDAHGSGVLGDGGRGTVHSYGLQGRIDFSVGTLSKAIGSAGGYVSAGIEVRELLLHKCRPILFSTSMAPASAGAAIEAFRMLTESDEYIKALWASSSYLKKRLREAGFDTGISKTPITPVMIGDEEKTVRFSRALFEEGLIASPIVYPTVPQGKGRIRLMVSAAHDKAILDEGLSMIEMVGRRVGII